MESNEQQPTDYNALATRLLSEQDSSQPPQPQPIPPGVMRTPDGRDVPLTAEQKEIVAQRVLPEHQKWAGVREPDRETVEDPGYELALPGVLAPTEHADWEETVASFAEAAQADRLPVETAQHMIDLVSHTRAALPRRDPADADPDTARSDLLRYWGSDEAYRKNMSVVWKHTAENPRLRDWLEESGLGNDPGVIAAIALLPDTRLNREAARAELSKVMASKEFARGHKPTVARVALLSEIAHTDPAEARARRAGAADSRAAEERQVRQAAALADKVALRAEARQLIDVIDHGTRAEKAAASARWQQIMAQL